MKKNETHWENYEAVAQYILNDVRKELNIDCFEGKQLVKGEHSGTIWEIDGKGIRQEDETFFIVECRLFTKSRQSQERMAAFAYRISDTGASGGFIVSPLGLQEGAEKVAKAENIHSIRIDPRSTTENYVAQFLDQIKMHLTEKVDLNKLVQEKLSIYYVDNQGNRIPTRKPPKANPLNPE